MQDGQQVPWSDLDTKGFIHIPGFLTPEQVESCRKHYAGNPQAGGGLNVPNAAEAVATLTEPIGALIRSVVAHTGVRVDSFASASYFATERGVRFEWHQDHGSYYFFQTHANYLNLYIPIIKPAVDKSNLSVVPFDALARHSPDVAKWTMWSGATSVVPHGSGQLIVSDQSGRARTVPFRFDDIACTPQLNAGDLLLVRGDLFHKTQDSDTDRVALSIRLAHSSTVIRRSTLAYGGTSKANLFQRNMGEFITLFRAFDLARRNSLSWGELQPLMTQARTRFAPPRSTSFFLLKQKVRSGVVLRSAAAVVREKVINRLKYPANATAPQAQAADHKAVAPAR
jgi:hypothetical protein